MKAFELWRRILFLLRQSDFDREIEEEIRFHVEMRVEENLAAGMTADQARHDALRRFGNRTIMHEESRQIWVFRNLEVIAQDLRYAFRMLLKKPAFALVAITALALGIGANTAIFSAVNAVLLRPLPFDSPERIVNLFGASAQEPDVRGELSYPDFLDYKTRSQTLEHLAIYLNSGAVLTGDEEPERVTGADVSADLFPLLGVKPLVGRVFTPEEEQSGDERVVVLSYEFWQNRFGADPNLIGQTIRMGGSRTVIGVMPQGFKFPIESDKPIQYWMPISYSSMEKWKGRREAIFLPVVARLRQGVTIEQAQTELSAIAGSLEAEYPASNTNRRIRVVAAHEDLVREIRLALLVLSGAVGFVLLIACANVANLLLARAAARAKEITIRAALGASRARILRQLLVESLLLSFLGGAAGLLLAVWGIRLLVKLSPADMPRIQEISLDTSVLVFTLIVSVLTGIIFGLTPAIEASKADLNEMMKEGSKGSTQARGRPFVRGALVVGEVALSLVLVIGTGLLVKSFMRLMATDPGYETERVLVLDLPLSAGKYPQPEQRAAFFQQLIHLTRELPGVEAAGATTLLPLGDSDIVYDFNVEGRPTAPAGSEPAARYQIVSPTYFPTMRMALSRGREFTDQDAAAAPQVIIINEAFARRYFPDEDPIGRRLVPLDKEQPAREIVGVIGDVRQLGLDKQVFPIMYVPHLQEQATRMQLVVRTVSNDPGEVAPVMRSAIRQLNPSQIIWQTRTMNDLLAKSVAPRRFNMVLLGTFTAVALILAVIGIFGVMNYTVIQRTHEIGIRMALGARRGDVLRMVIGQGMALVLIGLGVGLAGAFALTRVLSSLLYGVSTTDPAVFAGVAFLFTAVALVACYLPARRAMSIDPMVALRYE